MSERSPKAREYVVSFINSLASEYQGRTYLLTKPNIVQHLAQLLFNEQRDTYLRQNALGALQKFSLRREAQQYMIECDIIPWILRLLSGESQLSSPLSDYSLEYATALLMNLSLRSRGKDICEK